MVRLRLLPEAWDDYFDAIEWYKSNSPRVAQEFEEALDQELAEIVQHPERWPVVVEPNRGCSLPRFPFQVIYQILDDAILVVALAHGSRRPGYWKKRLED